MLMHLQRWFLDHTNYARWIPVHLSDMHTLKVKEVTVLDGTAMISYVVIFTAVNVSF